MTYLPNRTSVVIAIYLYIRKKLTFTATFLVHVPDQFDAFFNQ